MSKFEETAKVKRGGLVLTYWRTPERVIDATSDREALAVAALREAARKQRREQ